MDLKKIKNSLKYKITGAQDGSAEEDPELETIREELIEIKRLIASAYSNFNAVTDKESISYYIYLIKAYEVKYDALVKRAKQRGSAVQEGLLG